ncbi:hypothetical protein ACMXYX_17805 (plasmid) [Neptuniibacter sp. QD72_48]|uniref:DUF7695 domain-containing protein n=1 Tax=Neptuniibacter sp. QD72_48 TaxID=3398214 RepID=UPI0039F5C69D
MSDRKLLVNAAKCRLCGDLIESTNRAVKCSCGALTVSGADMAPVREGDPDNYINLVVWESPEESYQRNKDKVYELLAVDGINNIQKIVFDEIVDESKILFVVLESAQASRRANTKFLSNYDSGKELCEMLGVDSIRFSSDGAE